MTLTTSKSTAFTYREVALHDRLREVAREVAMKPAPILGDRTVTYAELDAASDRLAGALARRGIARGDRVTLFMPNSIEFVIASPASFSASLTVASAVSRRPPIEHYEALDKLLRSAVIGIRSGRK